uniref:protein-tyrosine-phosphatase n=1 Tax=Cyanistes caeruleus TaxID=156563 RepID=A0A8C0US37_CYACU
GSAFVLVASGFSQGSPHLLGERRPRGSRSGTRKQASTWAPLVALGSQDPRMKEKMKLNQKNNYMFLFLLFQGGPVEILPFLYLGSAYHASKCEFLANLHITALLNVSRKSSDSFKDQYCYKWIPVEDSHTADISSHFQEAIDFIAGGKILVHCEAGISRSPTICMAYLMKTKKLRLDEAFDYIKQRRSLISPNFGFMGQLLQYESEILSSTPSVAFPVLLYLPLYWMCF